VSRRPEEDTMQKLEPLFLHEQVTLLALRDRDGTLVSGTLYPYAVGGAVLAELLLSGRAAIEGEKKKVVTLRGTGSAGDPLLDECAGKIATAKRRASPETWVTRFASTHHLHHRIAEGLCRRRILRAETGKVLLVFDRTTYPQADPKAEREIVRRLREAIFTETREVDPRTAVLVALAKHAGLLDAVFGKKEIRGRKERVVRIAGGSVVGKATKSAIDAMSAALMVACVVPVLAASS
jgi:hypothetical protein